MGEYVYDIEGGRHQAFYSPVRPTEVMGEIIRPHERIQVEQSLKWSQTEAEMLWSSAGMTEVARWKLDDQYGKWSLSLLSVPLGASCMRRTSCPPRLPGYEGAVITF